MPNPSNAAMIAANEKLFAKAQIRPEWQGRIDAAARRLCDPRNKAWFTEESARLKRKGYDVPWFMIAVTKEMEAGSVGSAEDGAQNIIIKTSVTSKTASAILVFAVNLAGFTVDPDKAVLICDGTQ